MKEMVTAGNCPWRLTESASLRRWNWLRALRGTGVETMVPLELLLPPPPPPDELALDGRVVPVVEVLALDEMLLEVLVLESTLAFEPEEGDSAEPELTLDSADDVPRFAADSAEVEDAGDERPPEVEGVNSVLLAGADEAAPAPEDDPAVLDAATEVLPD